MSELVRIVVSEADLDRCRIFINQGKGAKDRYILLPASFRLVLKSHLRANSRNRYLFETRRCGPFTSRRIRQIVQEYRTRAGITQPVHPHLFRHQMLTYIGNSRMSPVLALLTAFLRRPRLSPTKNSRPICGQIRMLV